MDDFFNIVFTKHPHIKEYANKPKKMLSMIKEEYDILFDMIPYLYCDDIDTKRYFVNLFTSTIYEKWSKYDIKDKNTLLLACLTFLEDTGDDSLNTEIDDALFFIVQMEVRCDMLAKVIKQSIVPKKIKCNFVPLVRFYHALLRTKSANDIFYVPSLRILKYLPELFVENLKVERKKNFKLFYEFVRDYTEDNKPFFTEYEKIDFLSKFFHHTYTILGMDIKNKKIDKFKCSSGSPFNLYLLDVKTSLFEILISNDNLLRVNEKNIVIHQKCLDSLKRILTLRKVITNSIMTDLIKISTTNPDELSEIWNGSGPFKKYLCVVSKFLKNFFDDGNEHDVVYLYTHLNFLTLDLLCPILSLSEKQEKTLIENNENSLLNYLEDIKQGIEGYIILIKMIIASTWPQNKRKFFNQITKKLDFTISKYIRIKKQENRSKAHAAIILLYLMNDSKIDYNYNDIFYKCLYNILDLKNDTISYFLLLILKDFKTNTLSREKSLKFFKVFLRQFETDDPILFECAFNASIFFYSNSDLKDEFFDSIIYIFENIERIEKSCSKRLSIDLNIILKFLISLNKDDFVEGIGNISAFVYRFFSKSKNIKTEPPKTNIISEIEENIALKIPIPEYKLIIGNSRKYFTFLRSTLTELVVKITSELFCAEQKIEEGLEKISTEEEIGHLDIKYFGNLEKQNENAKLSWAIGPIYDKIIERIFYLFAKAIKKNITYLYSDMFSILKDYFFYSIGQSKYKTKYIRYILNICSEDPASLNNDVWLILDSYLWRLTTNQPKKFCNIMMGFLKTQTHKKIDSSENLRGHIMGLHIVVSLCLNFPYPVRDRQDAVFNFITSYLFRDKDAIEKVFFIEAVMAIIMISPKNAASVFCSQEFMDKFMRSIRKNQVGNIRNINDKLLVMFLGSCMASFKPYKMMLTADYKRHIPFIDDTNYKNFKFLLHLERYGGNNNKSPLMVFLEPNIQIMTSIFIKVIEKIIADDLIFKSKENHNTEDTDVSDNTHTKITDIFNSKSFMKAVLNHLNDFGINILRCLPQERLLEIKKCFEIEKFI